MNDLLELQEKPGDGRAMIAGWHQWADAGKVSSGLPEYLIEHTDARKIGEIRPGSFYLFQIPGTHHLLRPVVTLKDGYRQAVAERANEFFYAAEDHEDFLIFLGEEPHQDEAGYADAFLDAVEELGVRRVVAVAGVHGPVPYDKNREISCIYSLPRMKEEMRGYAIRFSDYEGGATICTYLVHRAEERGVEMIAFYALAPAYDFSKGQVLLQQVSMDEDYKAWYDLMRRINHMLRLNVDLADLERRGNALTKAWKAKIDQLAQVPHLDVKRYLDEIEADFTERTFEPLSHVWEDALDQILDDSEDA